GWLPHLRPGRGQDCRLLLAFDHDQAAARAQELVRRLEDHLTDIRTGARTGARPTPAPPTAPDADRRPAWANPDDGEAPATGV
ncbi:hypothetical protein NGM37_04805, partial [Streptomyces sp. TRM76130]|nr:hypothetical protein [Streptomyces sp. TRM76130]